MTDRTANVFRAAIEASFEMAPPSPDLPLTGRPARSRRPAIALASGFVAVLLTVGLGTIALTRGDHALPSDEVTSSPAISDQLGPEPRFDTGALGEEYTLDAGGATITLDEAALVENVQRDINPDYRLVAPPVFVGRVGDVQGFVATFEKAGEPDLTCQIIAQTARTWGHGMGCSPPAASHMGISVHSPEGEPGAIFLVSTTDPEISVVAVQIGSGERYWERPILGNAMFVITAGDTTQGFAITAYDAAGNTIGTENGVTPSALGDMTRP